MLSWNVKVKQYLCKTLTTFFAFITPIWAVFKMDVHITLLNFGSTIIDTISFKFTDKLFQAHISFKLSRQLLFAIGTFSFFKIEKAFFANNSSTLNAVKRYNWQLKATDTF